MNRATIGCPGKAVASNCRTREVWSWDIAYLPSLVRGQFYRLYLITDIYSRMITGWKIHHDKLASHAAELITRACLRHGVTRDTLVLHSDNGSSMKRPPYWRTCSAWASCRPLAVPRSRTTTHTQDRRTRR